MKYDLEDRTLAFSKAIRIFTGRIQQSASNRSDIDQCIRSSGSIGANYLEANESLGKKDFLMRIRICRKEAKETEYWLKLIVAGSYESERQKLEKEASELTLIFGAILRNSVSKIR